MTMQPWQPQMTERPHPAGYAGIKASLDAVVARIREGRKNPQVRAWAGKMLVAAGNPKGHVARAQALFDAMRKQNIWVPDPRGVEYMPGAHLILGDGDNPPEMPAEDCDGLTLAYLSACESVGIPTAVVGASYDKSRAISHVLGMVTDEKGAWYYADPSVPEFPFGQAHKATYEEVIDVATGKRICQAGACSVSLDGQKPPDTQAWSFVGVNGPPEMGVLGDGSLPQTLTDDQIAALKDLSAHVGHTWDRAVSAYKAMGDVFSTLGLPPPGDPNQKVWTPEAEQMIRDAQVMVGVARMALDQAVAGQRQVAISVWDSGPLAGLADTFIGKIDADTYVIGLDGSGRPSLFLAGTDTVVHSPNAVGNPWLIGGAIAAVVSIAIVYAIDSVSGNATKQAEIAAADARNKREIDGVTSGALTPEQLERLRKADAVIAEYNAKKADAENRSPIQGAGEGAKAAGEGIADALKGAAVLAAVLGVGYFGYQALQSRKR